MDLEDYLIEEKSSIMAINSISQVINQFIDENYYKLGDDKIYIEEISALNCAIQMIAYCMRVRRKECYQKIDQNIKDEFTYDSVMYENI